MQHGAEDVEDIAQQPDDDEEEGQASCGVAAEVFEDLRRKDDDPAGYGDGSGIGLEGVWWGAKNGAEENCKRDEGEQRERQTRRCRSGPRGRD